MAGLGGGHTCERMSKRMASDLSDSIHGVMAYCFELYCRKGVMVQPMVVGSIIAY